MAQFFPLFLLGALFGKLMEDSGSVAAIAEFMTEKLGPQRSGIVRRLAGAMVTYGGVSLFVAFFVLAPMAQTLFRTPQIPNRLIPAAVAFGTSTFTMSALPGTPAIQNAIPMPFFGTTPFAAPGLGIIASRSCCFRFVVVGTRRRGSPRQGEGYGADLAVGVDDAVEDETVRQRATTAHEFDPRRGPVAAIRAARPADRLAALPLIVVVSVNVLMTLVILPSLDVSSWPRRNSARHRSPRSAACGRW